MRIEEVSAVLCERHAALVVAKVNDIDEAVFSQVLERLVVDVEVVFGDNPEGADGG